MFLKAVFYFRRLSIKNQKVVSLSIGKPINNKLTVYANANPIYIFM